MPASASAPAATGPATPAAPLCRTSRPARALRLAPALALVAAVSLLPAEGLAGSHRQPRHQTGIASFYGREFRNQRTASGERFDPTRLTAAHRTLPFGTRVRVTNLENGRRVVVRINDRGPFARGRLLDLSPAAARKLGFVNDGVARVRIDVLKLARDDRARTAGIVGAQKPRAEPRGAAQPAAPRRRATRTPSPDRA